MSETPTNPGTFRAEDYEKTTERLADFEVGVTTYKLRDRYHCKVDNVSPGAIIARAVAATRQEARDQAMKRAADHLSRTQRH